MTTLLIFNLILLAEISIAVRIEPSLTQDQAKAFDTRTTYCYISMSCGVVAMLLGRAVQDVRPEYTSAVHNTSLVFGLFSALLCGIALLGMTDSILTHIHNKREG